MASVAHRGEIYFADLIDYYIQGSGGGLRIHGAFFSFDLNWYFDVLREIAAPFDCSSSLILTDSKEEKSPLQTLLIPLNGASHL